VDFGLQLILILIGCSILGSIIYGMIKYSQRKPCLITQTILEPDSSKYNNICLHCGQLRGHLTYCSNCGAPAFSKKADGSTYQYVCDFCGHFRGHINYCGYCGAPCVK